MAEESQEQSGSKPIKAPIPAERPAPGLMRRLWQRRWFRWGVKIGVYVGLIVVFLRWFEYRMTFAPSREWRLPLSSFSEVEEVTFDSEDGVRLSGVWFQHQNPTGAILYCHGNAGNLADRFHVAETWRRELGYSVFLFDYRGYGKSEGSPTEEGLFVDTRAAAAWLRTKTGVSPIIAGRSLGTVPAVRLAAEVDASALVIDSPMANARLMARAILPIPGIEWIVSMQLDNLANIGRVKCPILILHGDDDEVIPFDQGRKVYDAAPKPKLFIPLRGYSHNDPREHGAPMTALQGFIGSL